MKKFIQYISVVAVLMATATIKAQTGEQLFKQCNVCHLLGKNSTGPDLKGVKAKWNEAGEGELLYEWVKNPADLLASGKSSMAKAIEGFSTTMMSAQNLTNEQIDAVFDYIDNWEPAAATADAPSDPNAPKQIVYVPNYEKNLTLFYWMIGATVVLLLAIIMMSGSISTLIKSDYFKKKLAEMKDKAGNTTIIILIISTGLIAFGNKSYGFTFNGPGAAEAGEPWLLIENSDLTLLLMINLVLLGVVFYLRRMFNQFMEMVRPKTARKTSEQAASKLNKVLTDVVPIEEEHTILLHHEYDGIKELDNNLPPWWVWMFYATIIFGVGYIFHYHILGTGDLQVAEFEKAWNKGEADAQAYKDKMALNVDETTATLLTDEAALSTGKVLFTDNCATCHEADGRGNSGPNLTDEYWLYGGDIKDLFKTIKYGTQGGMPTHNDKLTGMEIQKVASYVLSLPYTKGLDPQGELYQPEKEEEKAE